MSTMRHQTLWRFNLLSAAILASSAAMAADSPSNTATDNTATDNLEEVVVYGTAFSQKKSIDSKRDNFQISDVVGVDALGRLPDNNVAEAAARLPGLSVVRDQQTGEGALLTVRGLDSGLNTYSINGVRMGTSGGDDRGVSLNVLPPDGVQKIEVKKTSTPDMDGDALGGSVNVQMPTAFDYKEQLFSVSADYALHDRSDETGAQVSGAFATRFGANEQFGLYVGGYTGEKDSVSQETENDGDWMPTFNTPSTSTKVDEKDFQIRGLGLGNFENELERQGANFSLDYRPNDTSEYHLRGQVNEYSDIETDNYSFITNERASSDPADHSDPANVRCNDFYDCTTGRFDPIGIELGRNLDYEKNELKTSMFTFGGKHFVDAWTVDYDLSFAQSNTDTPYKYEVDFEGGSKNAPWLGNNNVQWAIDDPRYPKWVLNDAGLAGLYDLNNYQLDEFELSYEKSEDKRWIAQTNVKYDFELQNLQSVQFGLKASLSRRIKEEGELVQLNAKSGLTMQDLALLIKGNENDFFDSEYTGVNRLGQVMSGKNLKNLVDSCDSRFFDSCAPGSSSKEDEVKLDENIYSAYLMGTWQFGENIEVTAGARVEHTDLESEYFRSLGSDLTSDQLNTVESLGLLPSTGAADVFATEDTSYTHVLPSLHVNYHADDNLIYRGAIWTSVIRPEFQYIAGGEEYSYDYNPSDGSIDVSIDKKNLDLKATEAINFDLGVEYYMPETNGMISAAVYHKDIEHFFIKDNATESSADSTNATGGETSVSEVRNGGDANVTGIELGYTQQFSFLPEPWDGLGVVSNVMLQKTEAETDFQNRSSKVPLVNAPKRTYNFTLYYEKFNWEARLSYQYSGLYLEDLRNYQVDKYIQPTEFVDLSVSKFFPEYNLRVIFKAANLTEEHLYWATRGKHDGFQKDYVENGRTFNLGLNWKY